jgi:uncharacterized DUF497 family protein
MRLTWDPAKSDANLRERGFDFAFASLVFDGRTLEQEDRRHDYGERRIVALGLAQGIHVAVVYTDRVDAAGEIVRRIIAARRSSRHEREAWNAATAGP